MNGLFDFGGKFGPTASPALTGNVPVAPAPTHQQAAILPGLAPKAGPSPWYQSPKFWGDMGAALATGQRGGAAMAYAMKGQQGRAGINAKLNFLRNAGAKPDELQLAAQDEGAMDLLMQRALAKTPEAKKPQSLVEFEAMQKNPAYADYMRNKGAQAFTPKPFTFYDQKTGQERKGYYDQNGQLQVIGGQKARSNFGFEVTTPDGTTIRQGAFGKQDQKNVANRVTAQQELAASASDLKSTVKMLRDANNTTGYTGIGGGFYDGVDSTLEQFGLDVLPGSPRSRSIMRSGGLDVALEKVSKTKGAISNAEMALFMAASPGLQTTPEGNAAILDMAEAIADRQISKSEQMEKWRQQNGTLDGFEVAWSRYIEANPIILDDGKGGIKLAGQSDLPNNSSASDDPLGIRK